MSRFSMFDLTGKAAIITGGYHGIGRGIVDGLVKAGAEERGASHPKIFRAN